MSYAKHELTTQLDKMEGLTPKAKHQLGMGVLTEISKIISTKANVAKLLQEKKPKTQVMMDEAKAVTATWRTDSTLLYATIVAVLVAIALVAGVGFHVIVAKLSQDMEEQAGNGESQTDKSNRTVQESTS